MRMLNINFINIFQKKQINYSEINVMSFADHSTLNVKLSRLANNIEQQNSCSSQSIVGQSLNPDKFHFYFDR